MLLASHCCALPGAIVSFMESWGFVIATQAQHDHVISVLPPIPQLLHNTGQPRLMVRRPFHLLPQPRMEVFLTDNRGHGVRAAEPIARGTFVVEYAGTPQHSEIH